MKKIKHLLTKQGEALTGEEYNVYPRPQLKRASFFSLNGRWELCVDEVKYDILVPYPPESILSGIGKHFGDGKRLIYKKRFALPEGFLNERVILNIGAVDQSCEVYLNGALVGENEGGYNSFSLDITDYLGEENELKIEAVDKLRGHNYPYGKQKIKRGGMWYTPVSGIWQSVWLESVPKTYVKSIKIDTGCDFVDILVDGVLEGNIILEGKCYQFKDGFAHIELPSAHLWSPESPYLYYFTVEAEGDRVEAYFALRTLEIKRVDGFPRICLNGKPYFFHALLDQGYYSDGIYTPASPSLYEEDILKMKELGFNTLRKHIKIEPEWFYYYCDKHGMIVFQDMVNNGRYSFLRDTALPTVFSKKFPEGLIHRSKRQRKLFLDGMKKTVNQLYNHPCICYYTIFNEGWGQFESEKMYKELSSLDSSRIIDTNSGWFGGHTSDVESLHIYFKPVKIKESERPIILSEFGGYSYKEEGHVANVRDTYGYRFFKDREKFEQALIELYENEIIPAISKGLCGAIYTQVSDVEDETNGLLTYDRRFCKVDSERMLKIAEKLKI